MGEFFIKRISSFLVILIIIFFTGCHEIPNVNNSNLIELPHIQGKVESCLICHAKMQGFSRGHEPDSIGCSVCHGGNASETDKLLAHKNMVPVPGNLSNASTTCGTTNCHPAIVARVSTSMMATLSGMISVDKWVFGEIPLPIGNEKITEIGQSASEVHLRNLCAGCHIGNEKTSHGNPTWLERGGGCNACHLKYNEQALSSLHKMKMQAKNDTTVPIIHPSIDLNISNDHCMSCHSRSGRISTNYEGWQETMLKPNSVIGNPAYNILPDNRVFSQMPADVHHEKGMLCIDCHNSYELMGDGTLFQHKEDAVKILCSDCHSKKASSTRLLSESDFETQKIAKARNYRIENVRVITTKKSGYPLVNTFIDEKSHKSYLIKKSTNDTALIKSPLPICIEGKSHERLSCESCHSAWVSQCIGCHTSYEAETKGYDMLSNQDRNGTWIEYASEGLAELPILGMRMNKDSSLTIGTFAPGMIMNLDHNFPGFEKETTFHRLYAPVSAHTTIRKGRNCKSCHNSSLAIGYGRGKLEFSSNGHWSFYAEYQDNPNDKLPEDAWIGFLKERSDLASTRLNMRPFTVSEQKKILTVGICLSCHDESSSVMQQSLVDFEKVLRRRSSKCKLPAW